MRLRTPLLLLALLGTLAVAPAAQAAAAAPILHDVDLPAGTDGTPMRIDDPRMTPPAEPACPGGGVPWHLQYSIDGGTWRTVHRTRSFVVVPASLGFGRHLVTFRLDAGCGIYSNELPRSIYVVAPEALEPKVNSVTLPARVDDSTVPVKLVVAPGSYGAGAVSHMRFATESGNWGAWVAYSPTAAAPVSPGLGLKALYIQVADGERESTPSLSRFTRVAPTTASNPTVGSEVPVLRSATVLDATSNETRVTISATDDSRVALVRFATEDGNWHSWQPYEPSLVAPVSVGNGAKVLYVQVADAGWRTSTILSKRFVARSASTIEHAGTRYESAAPANASQMAENAGPRHIAVHLASRNGATEARGRLTHIRFANETGGWGAWRPHALVSTHEVSAGDNAKMVFVQVRDESGRLSNVLVVRAMVDSNGVVQAVTDPQGA